MLYTLLGPYWYEGPNEQANLLRMCIAPLDQNHTPLCCRDVFDIYVDMLRTISTLLLQTLFCGSSATLSNFSFLVIGYTLLSVTSGADLLGQTRKYSACGFLVFVCTISPYAFIVMSICIRCRLIQPYLQGAHLGLCAACSVCASCAFVRVRGQTLLT